MRPGLRVLDSYSLIAYPPIQILPADLELTRQAAEFKATKRSTNRATPGDTVEVMIHEAR